MKKLIAACFISTALIGGGLALAKDEKPKVNTSENKHVHLHAAQEAIDKAWVAIGEAQKANDFDMEGHAAKAKDLLEQANKEIKLAAEAANKNAH
jgi:hypothetical protein